MRHGSTIVIDVLLVAAVFACGGEERGQDSDSDARQPAARPVDSASAARVRTIANGLGGDLQKRLFAALDSGGPERGIGVCSDSAQAWTARHAGEGTYVRRVSLKVRNPRNAPDDVERAELRRLDSLHHAGKLPGEIVRRGANGEVEYMRPIVVQARCLACHGDTSQMSPRVRALITARYPKDEATGYREGDLRGMLVVRLRE